MASPDDNLRSHDPELAALLDAELVRQRTTLQLIASENFASPAVMAATGSVLTNKYAEGYPGKRYYGGNIHVDEVEDLARERLKALFGVNYANVQPHSGANANLGVYQALLQPGDTVLAMRLDQGGHLTHGSPASITSRVWNFVSYGLTPGTDDPANPGEVIDMDQVRSLALEHRPKLLIIGASSYSRTIDAQDFRSIADEVGALLMFDCAHTAGLIAGGAAPNPVGVADVMTFTTHKTLRGPRGGAVICNDEALAKKIDSAIFPGLQGGPLEHVIAAKAVAFKEALDPAFKTYIAQVVANASALAEAMVAEGFRLISGGTDNHLVVADLRTFDAELTGKEAQETMDRGGITANRNSIPDDPRSPFVTSGVRLGTAAETTAGMGTAEMATIASLIARVLRDRGDDHAVAAVRAEVAELCGRFDPYASLAG